MKDPLDESAVFARRRRDMVEDQLVRRGIADAAVLTSMGSVPRHAFVLERDRRQAYEDHPIPIGLGQTISQPYVVALMSELARIQVGSRILDVGTGSGYQAAVLAALGADVRTIEIVERHATRAAGIFADLGLSIESRCGDGHAGWPEAAPFHAIVVAAAPKLVPEALLEQLEIGGRLILPVGDIEQELLCIERNKHGWDRKRVTAVSFVPMTGGSSIH